MNYLQKIIVLREALRNSMHDYACGLPVRKSFFIHKSLFGQYGLNENPHNINGNLTE